MQPIDIVERVKTTYKNYIKTAFPIIDDAALITAPATFASPALLYGSPWWTERRWWDLDRLQNRGKHRPRFLPEKPLRRGRPICPREAKVMHRCQTFSLSRVLEPSQLMIPQREIAVSSFDIGA